MDGIVMHYNSKLELVLSCTFALIKHYTFSFLVMKTPLADFTRKCL